MIRTQAHKQTQHQVFMRAAEAAEQHGLEWGKANVVPGKKYGLTQHMLEEMGYHAKSERDMFRVGYFKSFREVETDRDGVIVAVTH